MFKWVRNFNVFGDPYAINGSYCILALDSRKGRIGATWVPYCLRSHANRIAYDTTKVKQQGLSGGINSIYGDRFNTTVLQMRNGLAPLGSITTRGTSSIDNAYSTNNLSLVFVPRIRKVMFTSCYDDFRDSPQVWQG